MTNRIDRTATLTMLLTTADAITQYRVRRFITANEYRFESDGVLPVSAVHDKLRQCFDLQMQQSLGIYSAHYKALEFHQKLDLMAENLRDLAKDFSTVWGINPSKKASRFIVPNCENVVTALTKKLINDDWHRTVLVQSSAPNHPDYDWRWCGRVADIDSFLFAFHQLIVAKDTLCQPTGQPFFESLLAEYACKTQWLAQGYPHDLLVHDRRRLAAGGEDLLGIGVKPERCSTWAITEEVVASMKASGYTLHYWNKNQRKAEAA